MNTTIDDMIVMNDLTKDSLLNNLKSRYEKNVIYTYIGGILIAVNPYQVLPDLFSFEQVHTYSQIHSLSEKPPHIFGIASIDFRIFVIYLLLSTLTCLKTKKKIAFTKT